MTTDEHTPGGEDTPDLAFEALVAADPAGRGAPDLGRLRSAVAASVADEGAYVEPASRSGVPEAVTYEVDDVATAGDRAAGDVPAAPGEPGAEPAAVPLQTRPRGRAVRTLQVAAAGIAVLAVGAGGFLVGQRTPGGSGSDVLVAVDPSTRLESGDGSEAAVPGASMDSAATAAGTADYLGGYFGGYGRTVFTASGLSGAPGTATAWGLDVASVYSKESIEHLAAVLGVEGEAQQEGSWRVGGWDLPGPTLSIEPDGTGYLSYDDPGASPYLCYEQAVAEDKDAEDEDLVREPAQECAADFPEITMEQAEAQVRDVLERLGVDVASLTFTATAESTATDVESGGIAITSVWVSAVPTAGPLGEDQGGRWSAGVTGAGISSLSGPLAPLVDLGEYPTVSPAEAVERLMDPRFGGEMTSWAVHEGDAVWTPRTSAPATPTAGAAIEWPVENVTIVGSEPTHLSAGTSDGATVLLPAYELSAADGRSWKVLAVTESALDLATR